VDKRLLYLLGVAVGGVGVYLAYKWYGERAGAVRLPGIPAVEVPKTPAVETVRVETTPGGGSIEVRQASPDSVTIVYTNPQGSTSTITVPKGTEDAVIAMLKRGEAMQKYYTEISKEKPVYEIQPVPPGYADYGGVLPRLMERAPYSL